MVRLFRPEPEPLDDRPEEVLEEVYGGQDDCPHRWRRPLPDVRVYGRAIKSGSYNQQWGVECAVCGRRWFFAMVLKDG